jgi:hypothetical protein
MKSTNASLKSQIAKDQTQSRKMEVELSEARKQFARAEEESARLRCEIGMLQHHLRVTTLPCCTGRCSGFKYRIGQLIARVLSVATLVSSQVIICSIHMHGLVPVM